MIDDTKKTVRGGCRLHQAVNTLSRVPKAVTHTHVCVLRVLLVCSSVSVDRHELWLFVTLYLVFSTHYCCSYMISETVHVKSSLLWIIFLKIQLKYKKFEINNDWLHCRQDSLLFRS